jgi:hypothetical protein
MINADAPQTYIEYKNLNSDQTIAEFQKDVLIQVVKKILGDSRIFIESTADPQADNPSPADQLSHWLVRCQECDWHPSTDFKLDLSSLKKNENRITQETDVRFKIENYYLKTSSWRISLTEIKPVLVRSGDTVKITYSPSPGIQIEGAGRAMKNGGRGEKIHVQMSEWFSQNPKKNVTRTI